MAYLAKCMTRAAGLLAAIMLILPLQSFAGGTYFPQACPKRFGSFYVGAGINRVTIFTKDRARFARFDPLFPLFPEPDFASESSEAWDAGVLRYMHFFAGYETRDWCRFKLGAEVFLAHTPEKAEGSPSIVPDITPLFEIDSLSLGSSDFQMNTFYGIALLPAYRLNPIVSIYGRIGYVEAKTEFRVRSSGESFVTGTSGFLETFDRKVCEDLCGWQAGLGFDLRTSCHLTLRYGYTWTNYDEINLKFRLTDMYDVSVDRDLRRRPQMEAYHLEAIYHFTPVEGYVKGHPHACREIYGGFFASRDTATSRFTTQRSNYWVEFPENTFSSYNAGGFGLKGWGYEFFAGVGQTFCGGAYIGAELFWNDTNAEWGDCGSSFLPAAEQASQDGLEEFDTKFELQCNYGISFIRGFKYNDCVLVYGKVGFVKGSFKYQEKLFQDPANPRDIFVLNRTEEEDMYGYILGAGMDIRLYNNLYLRNEFSINYFGNVNIKRRGHGPVPGLTNYFLSYEYDAKVRLAQYKLGLEYRFPTC